MSEAGETQRASATGGLTLGDAAAGGEASPRRNGFCLPGRHKQPRNLFQALPKALGNQRRRFGAAHPLALLPQKLNNRPDRVIISERAACSLPLGCSSAAAFFHPRRRQDGSRPGPAGRHRQGAGLAETRPPKLQGIATSAPVAAVGIGTTALLVGGTAIAVPLSLAVAGVAAGIVAVDAAASCATGRPSAARSRRGSGWARPVRSAACWWAPGMACCCRRSSA